MNNQTNGVGRKRVQMVENGGLPAQESPAFLEGMKVLFDDKVGLYPVTLVAKKQPASGPPK